MSRSGLREEKHFTTSPRLLNLSFASVKTYLDTARHKLSCINLTHAVAVAIATGVIPAKALRWPVELARASPSRCLASSVSVGRRGAMTGLWQNCVVGGTDG